MVDVRARVVLDWLLTISFALVAITGIILLFYPHEGVHRGWRTAEVVTAWYARPEILQIHIWAGIAFVVLCLIHLAINWTCLISMTKAAMKKREN